MNNDEVCVYCQVCGALARLEEIPPGHSRIWTCKCLAHLRFVWYGWIPTNQTELDRLIHTLRDASGFLKPPGPKRKQPTYFEVIEAIAKLPADATLTRVATELGVSDRSVRRALAFLKDLELPYKFQDVQEEIKSKGKPRVGKRFFKDKRVKRR